MFTEYNTLKRLYQDQGQLDFGDRFRYDEFKWAWYSFVDLLDINFDEGFFCPHCGDDPDTFVMDATSVSFRKELASWSVLDEVDVQHKLPKYNKKRVEERTFASKALRNYFSMLAGKTGLKKSELSTFINFLGRECKLAEPIVNIILEHSITSGDSIHATDVWKDFVKCLASSYPVCSFITTSKEIHDLLRRMCYKDIRKCSSDLSVLQHSIPVIFKLVMNLQDGFPMSEFKSLLQLLIPKSLAPFEQLPTLHDEEITSENNVHLPMSYFPALKIKRGRGAFASDKPGLVSTECRKTASGHPSLLPGVFTLFCKHAPKLIVYDNACNLHTYCLNRDPGFFKNTVFRVDALHFNNHKACRPSYELKMYPQHKKFNSQLVEQGNSRLQRLKSQLSYMTHKNFMVHCKLYISEQNRNVVVNI